MFSLIVPTLDEERYIGALLDSLAAQTRRDFEVIVVDAGSTDRTLDVVASFRDRLERLRWVVEPRRGLSLARNVGASLATGEVLVFMEADCLVPEDFLEVVFREAEERGVGCANVLSRPLSDRRFDILYYKVFLDWVLRAFQYFFPVITGYCIYVRRDVFDKLGGFNEAITFEDTDFAQRARRVTRFRILKRRRLFTSVRRLDSDGRLYCLLRSILVTFYQLARGNIPINSRVYAFGHHRKDDRHRETIRRFPLNVSDRAFPALRPGKDTGPDPSSPPG